MSTAQYVALVVGHVAMLSVLGWAAFQMESLAAYVGWVAFSCLSTEAACWVLDLLRERQLRKGAE